jgi:hypothetical protein
MLKGTDIFILIKPYKHVPSIHYSRSSRKQRFSLEEYSPFFEQPVLLKR